MKVFCLFDVDHFPVLHLNVHSINVHLIVTRFWKTDQDTTLILSSLILYLDLFNTA